MRQIIFVFAFFLFLNIQASINVVAFDSFYEQHNLPTMSYFTNSTPQLNNKSSIILKLNAFGDEMNQGIVVFSFDDKKKVYGNKIFYAAEEGEYLSDPSLNDKGDIVFSLYNERRHFGIFKGKESEEQKVEHVLKLGGPFFNLKYSHPFITNEGLVFYQAEDFEEVKSIQSFDLASKENKKLFSTNESISYLFTMKVSDKGEVLLRVLQENTNDRIFKGHSDLKEILMKEKEDLGIKEFSHMFDINNQGDVLILAIKEDGRKALLLKEFWQEGKIVAEEGDAGIKEIEYFYPQINKQKTIVFRAIDEEGNYLVYQMKKGKKEKIFYEHQTLKTPFGRDAEIFYAKQAPPFGGNPSLNDKDEVAINASLFSSSGGQAKAILKFSPDK